MADSPLVSIHEKLADARIHLEAIRPLVKSITANGIVDENHFKAAIACAHYAHMVLLLSDAEKATLGG